MNPFSALLYDEASLRCQLKNFENESIELQKAPQGPKATLSLRSFDIYFAANGQSDLEKLILPEEQPDWKIYQTSAVCQENDGIVDCTCNQGFLKTDAGLKFKNNSRVKIKFIFKGECVDIDECEDSNPCDPDQTCYNTKGGHFCDENECLKSDACGQNEYCQDTFQSFVCYCMV